MLYRTFLLTFALASIIVISVIQNASGQGPDGPATSSPVLKDAQGITLSSGSEGQLTIISITAFNGSDDPVPFVAIIESRDESGTTQLLGFSIGSVEDGAQSEAGISWTPEKAGDYQLRTFPISGFENPQVLTAVRASDVVIE
jgi:hypothetical protein